jgi:uncharacterized membrane protein YeaQ/YmgE (transglycosylase-associated protein family)
MVMNLITWCVLGLIAGAIAKAIMPGADPGGLVVTMIIGIVGAFIGGFLAQMVGLGGTAGGFNLPSIITAVIGALVLLWIYRLATRTRGPRVP